MSKKGKKKHSWKSYHFKLYNDILIKYNSETIECKGWMILTNYRIEKYVKIIVSGDTYYGFRIIKNSKVLELYD